MGLPYNLPVLLSALAVAIIDWVCRLLTGVVIAFLILIVLGVIVLCIESEVDKHEQE